MRLISFAAAIFLIASTPASVRCDEPDNSFLLTLKRTACYGTCPIYEVTLEPNNTVTFVGERFVAETGEHTTSIDAEASRELLSKFDAAGFLDLPAGMEKECGTFVTDVPGIVLSFRRENKSRTVEDLSGCRGNMRLEAVRALAREVDKTLKTSQWIGGPQNTAR